MKGKLGDIHKELLNEGLAFHTLEPTADGALVYVYGEDQATFNTIDKVLTKHDTKARLTKGAEFISPSCKSDGTDREQRDDSRRQYELVIGSDQAQSAFQGRDLRTDWQKLRDYWGRELSQAAGQVAPRPPAKASIRAKATRAKATSTTMASSGLALALHAMDWPAARLI